VATCSTVQIPRKTHYVRHVALKVTHFIRHFSWLRDPDSNREPSGYGPDELPIALSRDILLCDNYIKPLIQSQGPERARGVEPLSPVWKTGIIAVI
jgi:hypothetical protein